MGGRSTWPWTPKYKLYLPRLQVLLLSPSLPPPSRYSGGRTTSSLAANPQIVSSSWLSQPAKEKSYCPHRPTLLPSRSFPGMESNRIKSSFFTERLRPRLSLWEQNATNCDASIVRAIQWAFHFQSQSKLKSACTSRLTQKQQLALKLQLYCFAMSEAKVKIISWPDIVSIILALCKAAVQMSPEMMMWIISNTNFIFMWNYSNAAVQHELPEPNQILRSIPSSECALDNKVLFCESVQYIKVDSLGQCVRYNTLIWAISISEAGTIKLVCCISNFFWIPDLCIPLMPSVDGMVDAAATLTTGCISTQILSC